MTLKLNQNVAENQIFLCNSRQDQTLSKMATGTTSSKELNPDASILGPRAARLARGPDISQLRQPIKTSISGTRQVIHALETATGDVKKFLLDEINLMYECKIETERSTTSVNQKTKKEDKGHGKIMKVALLQSNF